MLRDYCKERFRLIRVHLKYYLEKSDEEGLLQIRIEIKRIEALLRFVEETTSPLTKPNDYYRMIELFRCSGELWDICVQMKLAKRFGLVKLSEKLSASQYVNQQLAFKTMVAVYHKHNIWQSQLYGFLKKTLNTLTPTDLDFFILKLQNTIDEEILKGISVHDLPGFRKNIEVYLNLRNVLKQDTSLSGIYIPILQNLHYLIGQWNDNEQLVNALAVVTRRNNSSAQIKSEQARILREIFARISLVSKPGYSKDHHSQDDAAITQADSVPKCLKYKEIFVNEEQQI